MAKNTRDKSNGEKIKFCVVISENGTAAVKFHSCPVKHIRIRCFVSYSPIREICAHLSSCNVTQYPLTNYVKFCSNFDAILTNVGQFSLSTVKVCREKLEYMQFRFQIYIYQFLLIS